MRDLRSKVGIALSNGKVKSSLAPLTATFLADSLYIDFYLNLSTTAISHNGQGDRCVEVQLYYTKTLIYPAVSAIHLYFRKLLQSTPVGKHNNKIEVQAWEDNFYY